MRRSPLDPRKRSASRISRASRKSAQIFSFSRPRRKGPAPPPPRPGKKPPKFFLFPPPGAPPPRARGGARARRGVGAPPPPAVVDAHRQRQHAVVPGHLLGRLELLDHRPPQPR